MNEDNLRSDRIVDTVAAWAKNIAIRKIRFNRPACLT